MLHIINLLEELKPFVSKEKYIIVNKGRKFNTRNWNIKMEAKHYSQLLYPDKESIDDRDKQTNCYCLIKVEWNNHHNLNGAMMGGEICNHSQMGEKIELHKIQYYDIRDTHKFFIDLSKIWAFVVFTWQLDNKQYIEVTLSDIWIYQ